MVRPSCGCWRWNTQPQRCASPTLLGGGLLFAQNTSPAKSKRLSVAGTCGVGERARPTPSASGRTEPAPAPPPVWSASLAQHAQYGAAAQACRWGRPGRGTQCSSQQPTRRARRAQILVELAELQDQEVGDGTTSVVIVAAELLKRANVLVRNRIHPTSIISGYRLAMREARRRPHRYTNALARWAWPRLKRAGGRRTAPLLRTPVCLVLVAVLPLRWQRVHKQFPTRPRGAARDTHEAAESGRARVHTRPGARAG